MRHCLGLSLYVCQNGSTKSDSLSLGRTTLIQHLLAGKRVLVTRPPHQASTLSEKLRRLGAEPLEFPTIKIAPVEDTSLLDDAIAHISSFDWVIFTSRNAVKPFWERLKAAGKDCRSLAGSSIGVIGPKTASQLEEIGLIADFMPDTQVAEAIIEQIGKIESKKILLPRSHIARPALADGLRDNGAFVSDVPTYHTVANNPSEEAWHRLRASSVDIATFTSASSVHNFMSLFNREDADRLLQNTLVACIGPITAEAVREHGVPVSVVARDHTINGLVEAITELVGSNCV